MIGKFEPMLISISNFVVIAVAILVPASVVLAAVTFGAASAVVVGACILAGAVIGGAIFTVSGSDFLDGMLLGASISAAAVIVAFGISGSRKSKKKPGNEDEDKQNKWDTDE